MSDIPKKQHFVPEYYLRRFADVGENLYVYDQVRGKEYESRVRDVCERRYHYEMKAVQPRDWHGELILPGKIELRLQKLESKQNELLMKIDRQAEKGRINEKERRDLSWFVGHLIARHPAMLEGYPPDYEAMMSDPFVRDSCELLSQKGMDDLVDVLAHGANQMVLALFRCKGSPTYFIKHDLDRLSYHFIRPSGDARFITSSLPALCNTTMWSDGKEHLADLMLPLSSTLAVVYDNNGTSSNKVLSVPDDYVVWRNAGHFESFPTREQIVSGRKMDLDDARDCAHRSRMTRITRNII